MLPKENRLSKISDFNTLLKSGHWTNSRFFDAKAIVIDKNNVKKQLKLAVNAGLKVSKSAVVRNRLKRQMREAVRRLIKDGRLKTNHYILINAKKEAVSQNSAEISREIELLMSKAKVLC